MFVQLDVLLETDKQRLVAAAADHGARVAGIVAADADYCEALPSLYQNIPVEKVRSNCAWYDVCL